MKKNSYYEGLKFGLGILTIFSLISIVTAIGFHSASEIIPGTFNGLYTFQNGDSGASSFNGYTDLRINDDSHSVLEIISPNNYFGQISFGDNDGANKGVITYNHQDDSLTFNVNGAPNVFKVISSGNVGIGTATPNSLLQVGNPLNTRLEFMQIDKESGGPPNSQCDSDEEAGKLIIYDSNNLYVCNGASRGWDRIPLTD